MWYVVQCISGREESAIEKCRNALDSKLEPKIFSPICQFQKRYEGLWHTIEQIAFPGYILIESSQPAELEKLLQRISGVVVPVRIGGGFFPMREEEEAFLREMLDERDCIRFSVGYLVDGTLVVSRGPLKEKGNFVRRIDRHKRIAELELSLLGEKKRVKIGLEVKAKLTGEEWRKRTCLPDLSEGVCVHEAMSLS